MADVIGAHLTKVFRIDHGTTVDMSSNRFPFHHDEGEPTVMSMIRTHEADELLSAFDEVFSDLL
ncbi:hypothetical protein BDV23DRAFT_152813 [Aspergillus alliaceus]|uniref:Uncharacterized protein n=1 Tax=Petromyces alliaceus TaxID=209559 RepID=A0A5N7CBY8_PETAA|nr:hypothetical protein BDV23DRAFT_152813 [Aspergillus alliaceus]